MSTNEPLNTLIVFFIAINATVGDDKKERGNVTIEDENNERGNLTIDEDKNERRNITIDDDKKERGNVNMDDLHAAQYENLRKASLLMDVKKKYFSLQNEKLKLEIANLRKQKSVEEDAKRILDMLTLEP